MPSFLRAAAVIGAWAHLAIGGAGFAAEATQPLPRVYPGADWQEVTPESQGVDSAKMKEAVGWLDSNAGPDGAKELVVIRHGYLIWKGPNCDAFHPIWSCTKTFTSAVLGLLADDGECRVSDFAVKHLPRLDDQHPLYANIQLRHLASMSGGYRGVVRDVTPESPWGDPMAYLTPLPPRYQAGTACAYHDHDVFLLGHVLTRLAGESLQELFRRRIAAPVGMTRWDWGVVGKLDNGIALNNAAGTPFTHPGIQTTARELARFGLLYLNRGRWNGKQLLSASFVDQATTNQVPASLPNPSGADPGGHYGFYWWSNGVKRDAKRPWPAAPPGTYAAGGHSCNFCFVIPEWNMVVVRLGTRPIGDLAQTDGVWNTFFGKLAVAASGSVKVTIEAPTTVPCFDPAEFTVRVEQPPFKNPFTEAEVTAVFTASNTPPITVPGFADSEDGSTFRLRFAPSQPGAIYPYELRLRGGGLDERFRGTLRCTPSQRPGPVIAAPQHPRHFIYAGSGRPFYHLGYTAYHLLDPSNDDAQIAATIDYCAKHGFNKIRFLLAGYPRDFDQRTSGDVEYGVVAQAMQAPNYGARPGQVNPLPAWAGKPHAYDFTRFNVRHWQRVDDAIRRMRERGIVATCIFTIEKQDLPKEYGRLTGHEHRFYRYAIARLAAFDNVWWDLGNEHNEFRDVAWGNIMGQFVKETDPYDRLTSAHAYAEFPYAKSAWADFIITQQYGDCRAVHDWVLRYQATPKPYVNEEYGYEFNADKPGHGQNADWTRRCHWSIAMAGGYATYGDWSGGVAYFYMGEPGPGKAAPQLTHLRSFFEGLPFQDLAPRDDLIKPGFCLAKPGELYVAYLPEGGPCELDLRGVSGTFEVTWYDVRTGRSADGGRIAGGNWRPLGPPPFSGDAAMRAARKGGP